MKLKALVLIMLLPAFAAAAEDCAKSTDACSSGTKTISPFLAASAAEPDGSKATMPLKRATIRQAAVSSAPASSEAAVPEPAVPAAPKFSSPLWVPLVLAGIAGLYFYLSGGRCRGRKK